MTNTGSQEMTRSNLICAKRRADFPQGTGFDEDLRTPLAGEEAGRPDVAGSLSGGQ